MFSHYTSQLVKALAVVSAVAALLATPAQASPSHRQYVDGWAFNATYNAAHPQQSVRLVTDHGFGQNTSDLQIAVPAAAVADDFDWRAAAIGALIGAIGAATSVLVVRRGRTRLVTP